MHEQPIKTFIIYAHEDISVRDRLRSHLNVQIQNRSIDLWGDYDIKPGEDWDIKITERLAQSELLILLLSADFFTSDYILKKELPEALRRHEADECRLVPVIARYCDWQDHSIGRIQAVPSEGRPIDSAEWPSKDAPYRQVVEGIKTAVREIREAKQQRSEKQETGQKPLEVPEKSEIAFPYVLTQAEKELKINLLFNFWTLLDQSLDNYSLFEGKSFFPQNVNLRWEIEKRIDGRKHQKLFGISIPVGTWDDEPLALRIQTSWDLQTDMGINTIQPNGEEDMRCFPPYQARNGKRDRKNYLSLSAALQKLPGHTWENHFFWEWIAHKFLPEFHFHFQGIEDSMVRDFQSLEKIPPSVVRFAERLNDLAQKIQKMQVERFKPIGIEL